MPSPIEKLIDEWVAQNPEEQEIDSLKQSIDRCTDPEKRSRLRDQLQARQVEFNMHLEERHRASNQ